MSCSGTCHLVAGRCQVFWVTGPSSNQISTSRRRRSAPLLGTVKARTTKMHTIMASSSLILLQRFDRNFLGALPKCSHYTSRSSNPQDTHPSSAMAIVLVSRIAAQVFDGFTLINRFGHPENL